MTATEIAAARALVRCTFLPGLPPKRFVRQMATAATNAPETPLTERQAAYLWRLVWSYRRQLGDAWAEKAATMIGRPERPARGAAQRRQATTAQLTLAL